MNFELKSKDLLVNTYILIGQINNEQIINNLRKFIKENTKEELWYKTNVKGNFTGFKSLIQNDDFLNFLQIIQDKIRIIYQENFCIDEAWGNLCCKVNDEVTEHDHNGVTGFCGILYLSEGGPGTYFKDYDFLIEEKIGKYVLFHPLLKHSVKKIEKEMERITVAFNMNQTKNWQDSSNIVWVNKKNEI
jgi:hypothetical protein